VEEDKKMSGAGYRLEGTACCSKISREHLEGEGCMSAFACMCACVCLSFSSSLSLSFFATAATISNAVFSQGRLPRERRIMS
jgi:hypothetical protein